MWKYIVTWCLVKTVIAPCPEAKEIDEHGREVGLYSVCDVIHSKKETTCGYNRVFFNLDSAKVFYKGCEEGNSFHMFNTRVDNIQIDSIFLNPMK